MPHCCRWLWNYNVWGPKEEVWTQEWSFGESCVHLQLVQQTTMNGRLGGFESVNLRHHEYAKLPYTRPVVPKTCGQLAPAVHIDTADFVFVCYGAHARRSPHDTLLRE